MNLAFGRKGEIEMVTNNAKEFYLTLEEKEKWAIRTFLRKNENGKLADELSFIEDEIHQKKLEEQHLK